MRFTVEVIVFALQNGCCFELQSGVLDLSFPLQMIVGGNKLLTN
jgi:hypothetical protein